MVIKGLKNIRDFLHAEHMRNRAEYYRRNPPRRSYRYAGESYTAYLKREAEEEIALAEAEKYARENPIKYCESCVVVGIAPRNLCNG